MGKQRTNQTKLSASLEDYLETIYFLSQSGRARSKDISSRLEVSRASVTGALRILKEKGLLYYEPYGPITLTPTGKRRAVEIAQKHEVLASFFMDILGLEREIAQHAACRTEHALGAQVIQRLLFYVTFIRQQKDAGHDVADAFKQFYESKC